MGEKVKSTHELPGGTQVEDKSKDDGVVNDSLGTTDPADTTGLKDDEKADCHKNQTSSGQKLPKH